MYANGNQIIEYLNHIAPPYLAEDWDMIGLQLGTANKEVRKIMLTLDVTEEVVEEAISLGVNMIFAHHPIIFFPLKHIQTTQLPGRLYEKLIKHDIAFFAAHTNLDAAEEGVSHLLASELQLENMTNLVPVHSHKLSKLVVFVPEDHIEPVRDAMCNAGAGWIGNYSHCTFNTPGVGTFMPREGTNPFIGAQGSLEKVNEIRLETIVSDTNKSDIIKAMLNAHPYEEVAYDLYPLEIMGKEYGYGKVGTLNKEMTLAQFIDYVKKTFELDMVRYAGDLDRKVSKIAISGGEGNDFIQDAQKKGVDVYISGDLKYHKTQEAWLNGLCLIDVGHYVERRMMVALSKRMKDYFLSMNINTEVILSNINTDPFRFR